MELRDLHCQLLGAVMSQCMQRDQIRKALLVKCQVSAVSVGYFVHKLTLAFTEKN